MIIANMVARSGKLVDVETRKKDDGVYIVFSTGETYPHKFRSEATANNYAVRVWGSKSYRSPKHQLHHIYINN